MTTSNGAVSIVENGRSGTVYYREPAGELQLYWEFGGGAVVAAVQLGTAAEWRTKYPWAAERRSAILHAVAAEVIRQKAPTCVAEIDERSGWMNLRSSVHAVPPPPPREFSMEKWRSLRVKLALAVLVVALIFGGIMWFKNTVLVIDPGKGVPLGLCVRTDTHIATLIQTLEAYTPSLHRDGSKDRFTVSIFIVPRDGSEPTLVPIAEGLTFSSYQLAKVLGSDGSTLWFDVNGLGGVDLKTMRLLKPGEVRDPQVPEAAWPFAPSMDQYMSAGFLTGANTWFGLHSTAELEREFAVKKFVRRVVPQTDARQMRRFHRGRLDTPVDDKYHRILAMMPIDSAEYLNAAFLRMDEASEPLRLSDPDGVLMIYTSEPGLKGELMVARVDAEGKIVWKVDTRIDRFKLSQILPGKDAFAFVGTRLPVPDQLSEPLLVVVDNASGKAKTYSLWR